jgi:hypothetical protein
MRLRRNVEAFGHFKSEIPRHNELVDELARKICKDLGIPYISNSAIEEFQKVRR